MKKLSRTHMKSVMGGRYPTIRCTITDANGNKSPWLCMDEPNANSCQAIADRTCAGDNNCSDLDCPGAD